MAEDSINLPPNQQLIRSPRWPVVGEKRPRIDASPWTLQVAGLIHQPKTWSLAEVLAMPSVERTMDVHCVTRWSRLAMRFRGTPLVGLFESVQPHDDAKFLSFVARSDRNHSTSIPLEYVRQHDGLIAWEANDVPLPMEHGGPLRIVVSGKYFYKSLKWLERIDVLAEDRLGYWEAETGYHNGADPWREERYVAASITKQQAAELISSRDFRGLDLRGLDAAGRTLDGLHAQNARLRDANFRGCELERADFSQANLSNAHFELARLRGANFRQADLEGANFSGADLRGCDLRGASLFGASFVTILPSGCATMEPLLDVSTQLDPAALDALTDEQRDYVLQRLARRE